MGNALEFILKLTDMLSPGMRQAAAISDTSSARIQSQFDAITNRGRRMGASLNELRERLEAINRVRFSTTHAAEFDTATRAARRLEGQIDRLENRGRGSSLRNWITGIAASLSIATIGQQAMSLAMNNEQQRISYSVMTGSQQKGDALLGGLRNYANVTPYQQKDVTGAAQTLLQFGVDQSKIVPEIKTLGDIAAGSSEKLSSLSLAYAQIQSAGKLQGQDLLQLVNAGFNPLLEISKMTGTSMADLRKQMESGAISADMVTKAFEHATGPAGMFYKMTEKQSQTLAGRWSTFMDQAQMKLLALGDALTPLANLLLTFVSALMDGEPAALAIAVAIGGLALAIWGGTLATSAWAVAQGALNAIMNLNPIVLIISLIIALGLWIYSIAKKYEGWGNSMKALWQIIKEFVNLNVIAWKSFGENIWYWIQFAWLKFEGFIQWIAGAVNNVFNAFKELVNLNFSGAKDALFKEIVTPASKELDVLQKKHLGNQQAYAIAAAASIQNIGKQWDKVGLKKIGGAKAVDPTTEAAAGDNTTINPDDFKPTAGKDKADAINGGGQRSIVINIAKQAGVENLIVASGKEALDEIESKVTEVMRRLFFSMNGASNS